ncbi:MAG TPA: phytoene desaturase family protein, partial [Flavihumibacter sp.]|nr:phytoene desaturase family protein [Flavihumibacter sp.]
MIDIIKGNLQYCKLPFVVMLQSVNDLFKTTKGKLPSVLVIGAGVAGLSTAAFLAKAGCQVRVLDKNSSLGGRARVFEADGYRFDMGPSWYWMPDVFERFFGQFGKQVADYYSLQRLDPSYRVYWHEQVVDVPADLGQLRTWFDSIEPGAAKQLDKFLAEAAYKYEVAMRKLVYMPGISVREFIDIDLIKGALRLDVFVSMKKHVARFFKDRRLQQLMEFPVLFLGAMAEHIPALYSLMNHADMVGGTWYPDGGMVRLPMAMGDLCSELGVVFQLNEEVVQLETTARRVQ